ncbi:hypothetical protein ACLB2K_006471 [Fragaria x ananassa]
MSPLWYQKGRASGRCRSDPASSTSSTWLKEDGVLLRSLVFVLTPRSPSPILSLSLSSSSSSSSSSSLEIGQ